MGTTCAKGLVAGGQGGEGGFLTGFPEFSVLLLCRPYSVSLRPRSCRGHSSFQLSTQPYRCLVTLTPEALGHVSTVAQQRGWGTLLAHTILPVERHAVPRRKGQPEMRVDILLATSSSSLLLSLQGMASQLSRQYSFWGTKNLGRLGSAQVLALLAGPATFLAVLCPLQLIGACTCHLLVVWSEIYHVLT